MRTTILYEDKDIIVAHKPAGLATQTAAVVQTDMVSELKNHLKGAYLGVVHRLDQPVEGVLAFGKTKSATAALSRQLADGMLNKRYYCVVCGEPAWKEGRLTDHLFKSAENRAEIVPEDRAKENQAKAAVLEYRILESLFADENLPENVSGEDTASRRRISLAKIELETGRFHQIRAQMAHAGMPLLGDRKYGDSLSKELSEKLCVRYVALCAYEVKLVHPVKKREMCFRAAPQAEIFQKFSKINRG